MAISLTPEDGSGLDDANCYTSLEIFNEYAELIGQDLTAYTEEQIKSAIFVAANKYIDRLHDFAGNKINPSQSMKLYTDEAPFNVASNDIVAANIEAAILHLKGVLFVDESTQDVNGDVVSVSSELDVLKKSVTYADGSRVATKFNTSTIDALLKPYIAHGSGGVVMRMT